MVETLERMFGKSTRVLIKDGEFNDVQGEYHHYDYSQRITNNGSFNIINNTIHNVGNVSSQVIYHNKRGSRSRHHGRPSSSSVAPVDANDNAPSPSHNPQSLVPIPNNPNLLPYGLIPPQAQSSGQYFCTESGDIRQMSAAHTAFMDNQMAHMMQEMESEFSGDDEDLSDDNMSATTRVQSLSADFNHLTIEELVSPSSRSQAAIIHGSSPTVVRAEINPSRHIVISGNHTEVDNNVYKSDFDSNKVQNNIIENSFGEGEQNVGLWRMLLQSRQRSKQAHNPKRR